MQVVIPGQPARPAPGGASLNDDAEILKQNTCPNIPGAGEHRYRVVENWAKLPEGWKLTDVASVAVDSKDRVYVFNRGEHPMVVLDRDGNFITSWGDIYVGEVGVTNWKTSFPDTPMPEMVRGARRLQKLERLRT